MIGSTVGQYRIVEKLGMGGMGEVYRAVDTMLEREVAIKVLLRFVMQDAGRLERFRSEAITLARLNHPNIAMLHTFFVVGNDYYMVMEYVQGENFESLLRRLGRLPLSTSLEWFCQALRGFEHAHARGVIHRDIKPANLMLNGEGTVKITDFGIARVVGGQRLTQTGKLIGTLEYMSPEQVKGQEQDARSDIYSLGILLHEMTTGQVPFTGASDYELMRSHLEVAPRPIRELDGTLPAEVEAAILKALAKDPAKRFQTAGEFRAFLEPALAHLPAPGFIVPPLPQSTREVPAAPYSPPTAPAPPAPPTYAHAEYSGAPMPAETVSVPVAVPGSAVSPPPAAVHQRPAGLEKLPAKRPSAWLTPKVALASAISFLVVVMCVAAATMRKPVMDAPGAANSRVTTTEDSREDTGRSTVDDSRDAATPSTKNGRDFSAVVEPTAPKAVITPIPLAPKPVAKPARGPAAKRAPPRPAQVKRSTPAAKTPARTQVAQKRASVPRRPVRRSASATTRTPRRRKRATTTSTPRRRSKTPRRSRPSGGGGNDVIGIIKNS